MNLHMGMQLWLWLGLVLWLPTTELAQTRPVSEVKPIPVFRGNTRILFQGDSITDGNRGRNEDPNHILGHGYVFIIAAKYGAAFPELNLVFLNRGVSGNKVTDLAERWQKDTLDLKPDILSVLIGVNDFSAQLPLDQYEKVYDKLLASVRAANPAVRLVLGEPFSLPVGNRKTDWEQWSADMKQRQEVVAKLAEKYHAALVRFQSAFDRACQRAPADHWIWDGIHPPTPATKSWPMNGCARCGIFGLLGRDDSQRWGTIRPCVIEIVQGPRPQCCCRAGGPPSPRFDNVSEVRTVSYSNAKSQPTSSEASLSRIVVEESVTSAARVITARRLGSS